MDRSHAGLPLDSRGGMNRSPPPYRGQTSIERIVDHLADIYLAVKGIAQEFETWNARPVSGRIFFNGVESMTTPTATDIPDNDVPAVIQWEDRFGDINQDVPTT